MTSILYLVLSFLLGIVLTVLALVIGFSSSGVYTNSAMYSCVVATGSYENEIMIFDTYNTWQGAFLVYNGNGVSVNFQ